jgi:hypothetical protein
MVGTRLAIRISMLTLLDVDGVSFYIPLKVSNLLSSVTLTAIESRQLLELFSSAFISFTMTRTHPQETELIQIFISRSGLD